MTLFSISVSLMPPWMNSQCQHLLQIPTKPLPQERWLINAIKVMMVSIKAVMGSELSSVGRAFGQERWQNDRIWPVIKEEGYLKRYEEMERKWDGDRTRKNWEINYFSVHLLPSPCSCDWDHSNNQQIYPSCVCTCVRAHTGARGPLHVCNLVSVVHNLSSVLLNVFVG